MAMIRRFLEDVAHQFSKDNTTSTSSMEEAHYESYLQNAADRLEKKMRANDCPKEELVNFEILGRFGKGFNGSVFKVRHRRRSIFALKVLPKISFTEETAASHGLLEKKIQYAVDSPFIVKTFHAFQDFHNLYLVMEHAVYGDLECAFETITRFASENLIKAFAAQIVLALEYLHACHYAFNDLKLANILLFEDGYLKLCDLGFVKKVSEEISFYYGQDWWDVGRTLTTLVLGRPPRLRRLEDSVDTYFDIFDHEPNFPKFVLTEEGRDFLAKLLKRDRDIQLGGGEHGAADVKRHIWFSDVDFLAVFHKKLPMGLMLPPDISPKTVRPLTEIPRSTEPVPNQGWFTDF